MKKTEGKMKLILIFTFFKKMHLMNSLNASFLKKAKIRINF